MNVFSAAACQNHPGREALGICVRCRAQVCSECVTKVDGINYCVNCLAALAQPTDGGAEAATRLVPALTWALVLFVGVIFVLMAWGMLEAALPEAA
ncbi:MAG: hypothetical protein IPK60_08370 [Sandaracinaceae bacterium]|nr:hypothetical protein [Sandaracinaceae bacterium]